jgi:diaphanous 1
MGGMGGGVVSSPSASVDSSDCSSGEFDSVGGSSDRKTQMDDMNDEIQPLQPQSTGGWSSWWISSGGEKANTNKETANTAKWYVDGIRGGNATGSKLVKHLISLRSSLDGQISLDRKLCWRRERAPCIERATSQLGWKRWKEEIFK